MQSLGVAAAALPWPALAQKDLPLVGVLVPGRRISPDDRIDAIRKGMQEAGLTEDVNYTFALRFADGVFDRLAGARIGIGGIEAARHRRLGGSVCRRSQGRSRFADGLFFVCRRPDLGWVLCESYVHPGGNATGNVMHAVGGEEALTQKRIGFFKELVPGLKRLGFIGTATSTLAAAELNALRSVAGHFGFEIVHYPIQGIDDVESAVASSKRDGVDAVYVSGEPLLYNNMARVLPFGHGVGKAHAWHLS